MSMTPQDLIDNFELLGNWEERYGYLIDLGRQLPPMADADHTEANKVRGCMSQVWLCGEVLPGPPKTLQLIGDSDAHIVKGLIAVLIGLCSGRSPADILALDIQGIFKRLGLENHITVNRRNGFFAMVERIRALAAAEVAAESGSAQ